MLATKPQLIVDDGCDLTVEAHKLGADFLENIIGGCEQTTSGVIRAKNMTKSGALKFPLIATNDNKTKHVRRPQPRTLNLSARESISSN